jgi:hypothetical protein
MFGDTNSSITNVVNKTITVNRIKAVAFKIIISEKFRYMSIQKIYTGQE